MARSEKSIEDAIQKHEITSTELFSSLDDVTDLSPLNALEQGARSRILQLAADLAEVCVPENHDDVVAIFERLETHLENWELPVESIKPFFARARGIFSLHYSSIFQV